MIRGHFDGASRGNPGAAGAGVVIYDDDKVIWRRAEPLGIHTNNEAEYMALGLLAEELKRRGLRGVEICGDSRLVIMQVSGAWKIKEPRLRELAMPIIAELRSLSARCRWVPREQNAEADRMSNHALDSGRLVEDLSQTEVPVESSPAPEAEAMPTVPMGLRRVGEHVWLVREGNEEYAVDLKHGRCTCSGRKGVRCRHVKAVLERGPDADGC